MIFCRKQLHNEGMAWKFFLKSIQEGWMVAILIPFYPRFVMLSLITGRGFKIMSWFFCSEVVPNRGVMHTIYIKVKLIQQWPFWWHFIYPVTFCILLLVTTVRLVNINICLLFLVLFSDTVFRSQNNGHCYIWRPTSNCSETVAISLCSGKLGVRVTHWTKGRLIVFVKTIVWTC